MIVHWPREKVIETVLNFYEKYKHVAVEHNGAWRIQLEILPRIELRVIISKNMKMITGYPVFVE